MKPIIIRTMKRRYLRDSVTGIQNLNELKEENKNGTKEISIKSSSILLWIW